MNGSRTAIHRKTRRIPEIRFEETYVEQNTLDALPGGLPPFLHHTQIRLQTVQNFS